MANIRGVNPAMRPPSYWVALIAGAIGAVVEMIPILTIQGLMLGVPPIQIFQSIASGMLGRDAYAGGLSTATLGAAIHLFISVIAALFFLIFARRWQVLLRRPALSGIGFGALAFIVMSWVVVPLSAAAFKPNFNPVLVAVSLAIHMLFFGLPIAFATRQLCSRGADR